MHRSRKLGIRLTTAAAVVSGLLVLPVAAQADDCTVAVTLAGGQQVSFDIDVPPNTPLSSISLPVTGTVVSVSESCDADVEHQHYGKRDRHHRDRHHRDRHHRRHDEATPPIRRPRRPAPPPPGPSPASLALVSG